MKKWKMPEWMETYRGCVYTGGNTVEDILNGDVDESPWDDVPLSMLQACVRSQISLLIHLHNRGLLP